MVVGVRASHETKEDDSREKQSEKILWRKQSKDRPCGMFRTYAEKRQGQEGAFSGGDGGGLWVDSWQEVPQGEGWWPVDSCTVAGSQPWGAAGGSEQGHGVCQAMMVRRSLVGWTRSGREASRRLDMRLQGLAQVGKVGSAQKGRLREVPSHELPSSMSSFVQRAWKFLLVCLPHQGTFKEVYKKVIDYDKVPLGRVLYACIVQHSNR